MTPIFITCDPARDTPPVVSCIIFYRTTSPDRHRLYNSSDYDLHGFDLLMRIWVVKMKEYLAEFHPDFVGLTGN